VVSTFDVDEIRRAARDLFWVSVDLDDEIDTFLLAVQAIGEPCGDAEAIGALLGPSVISAEDTVVSSLASVVEWLETAAANLADMADDDAATESDNAAAVAAIAV
jgi:hypothetical protein